MNAVELYPGVVADADILGGKPVVKGTRVPVELVLGQIAGGVSYDELEREYGITADGVKAALGYAAQVVADEVTYVTHPRLVISH